MSDEQKKCFEIGDVVMCHEDGYLLMVTGVIHDEVRLFVTDTRGELAEGREYEVHFSEVTAQWNTRAHSEEVKRLRASLGAIHYHAKNVTADKVAMLAIISAIAAECEACIPELQAIRQAATEQGKEDGIVVCLFSLPPMR